MFILRPIIRILVTAITVLIISHYIPGIQVENFTGAILFAVVFGVINIVIKPIVKFFALPIRLLTLGLFTFVINALLFMLTSYFIDAVEVDGFLPALYASLIVSIVTVVLNSFLKNK
ncbi:phage holin family protein [Risungbinella massiliensis]|uniref:phage holin family protein n=1 Tax=Risungbinella massiliensis TaxID=1329796 RepID=UPI00164E3ABC|nr:phage holin family protein [Risungbinella massiliensis]